MRGRTVGVLATVVLLVAACGQIPPGPGAPESVTPTTSAPKRGETATPSAPPATSPPTSPPATSPPAASPPPRSRPSSTAGSSSSTCGTVPERLSLTGVTGRALAFAPLDDPDEVVVEGRVSGSQAWSTSKVLVVAAFVATTAGGDPEELSAADRRLVTAALERSDGDAVRSLRQRIPGSPGRAMTAVLRAVGDRTTVAPDSYEGTMAWSLREQVRFMVALEAGEVVSAETSAYLLESMRPIRAHRWGLGTVGATTFKGGWLREGRVTRQMGLLDSYAVAIITDRGPVVRQTDGDAAHVRAMDDLAELLADRLAWDRRCGPS